MADMQDPRFLNGDDDAAIAYILKKVPAEVRNRIDEDDVQYLLDVEFDFYDEKGYLDDTDEVVEIDEDELAAYLLKAARKQGQDHVDEAVVEAFLAAEYAYTESLYRS